MRNAGKLACVFVLALFALAASPFVSQAIAQQCVPVEPDSFIAEGVRSIKAGEIPGYVLQGEQAQAFADDAGFDRAKALTLAVFVLPKDGEVLFMVVVHTAAGADIVCFGKPNDRVKAAIKKYFGVDA